MPSRRIWFDRKFELGLPPEALPDILERVRGTPARLEERVAGASLPSMVTHRGEAWSAQEHVGHLLDLEELWLGRVEDLVSGAEGLRPADLANRKTHEAGHDESDLGELVRAFREERACLVRRVERMNEAERARAILHPRLRQPMTVVDLLFFVAEHDDHHLAAIGELLDESGT